MKIIDMGDDGNDRWVTVHGEVVEMNNLNVTILLSEDFHGISSLYRRGSRLTVSREQFQEGKS